VNLPYIEKMSSVCINSGLNISLFSTGDLRFSTIF
jgi:hypothetical protein